MMKRQKFSIQLPKGRDKGIHIAMFGLMAIGLVMSGSSAMTSDVVLYTLLITWLKQAFFLVLGYLGYVWLAKHFSMAFVRRHFFAIMIIALFFAILPLGFEEVNGARAWIQIPIPFMPMTIQPSEFIKMICILILVVYLGDVKKQNPSLGELLKMPLFFIIGILVIIVIFQSDLGSGVVLLGMSVLVFMVASQPKLRPWQWLSFSLMILALVGVGFLLTPQGLAILRSLGLPDYMVNRFENTIDPFINRYGTGYQLVSSLMAFVKGNWSGVGFGKSLQKYGYLPAAQTDFILAVIAEETGFLFVLLVCGLTLFMAIKLMIHATRAQDDATRMILSGVAYYLLLHFILNVGGVTALLPLTGVPLLLISSGGSSTLSIMFALGIAQRQIALMRTEAPQP